MKKPPIPVLVTLFFYLAAIFILGTNLGLGVKAVSMPSSKSGGSAGMGAGAVNSDGSQMKRVTPADRIAAAGRAESLRLLNPQNTLLQSKLLGTSQSISIAALGAPDYFGPIPNYANSPIQMANGVGPVNLGYRWLDASGRNVLEGYTAVDLALPVVSLTTNGTTVFNPSIPTPAAPGTYTLVFDMAQLGVTWFSWQGASTWSTTVKVNGAYGAGFTSVAVSSNVVAGSLTNPALITVKNTGSMTWQSGTAQPVHLGYRWINSSGMNVLEDYTTVPDLALPSNIATNASATFTFNLKTPTAPGNYTLVFDMAQVGVTWFSWQGASTSSTAVTVNGAYGAAFTGVTVSSNVKAGATDNAAAVTVRNAGSMTWPQFSANPVHLGYRWLDGLGHNVLEDYTTTPDLALISDVATDASATFGFNLKTPAAPGNYTLVFDMAQLGVTWFSWQGASTSSTAVRVNGQYGVAFNPVTAPSDVIAGSLDNSVSVTVKNAGSMTWPANGLNPVNLGYRWINSSGVTALEEYLATGLQLAGPLAHNQSTTFTPNNIKAPAAPGNYTLVFDMAQVGVTWFSWQGASTSSKAVKVNGSYGASFNPVTALTNVVAGSSNLASVTVKNTGTLTWLQTAPDITGIRKFVDSLPGLTAAGANDLGQYIPVAVADTTTYPGSDYYEIGLVQYTEKLHADLPATTLRGYVQLQTPANFLVSQHIALNYPNGSPILDRNNVPVYGVDKPHYLGPIVVAGSFDPTKAAGIAGNGKPTRVKFTNYLPTGAGGDLFLPVDTTVMGAGMGPGTDTYKKNRATLHLHGGVTPWISDGTPHQWTTPAGETTDYPKGVSVSYVPDMYFDANGNTVTSVFPGATNNPGLGSLTFYYTNQQSARLMFYHDHAYGITRLNVYAGEAAGYLLQDPTEQLLTTSGVIPSDQIPLIIQDKTFVPSPAQLAQEDPTWDSIAYGGKGSLWFPHVYMPNQNPGDPGSVNAVGRWDYGPWFWPPLTPAAGLMNGPITLPGGQVIPGTPNPSLVPEAFMDTPVVNGTPYPYVQVGRKAYRFRILNASNDRSLNLQLYFAKSNTPAAVDPVTGRPTLQTDSGEVPMVTAAPHPGDPTWPATWPTDGRDGGVPDPTKAGPKMIQIGTEGGFLPAPVVLDNTPVGYEYNRRTIVVLNVSNKTLFLGPAERADVIVDFSGVPDGSKIILYNDAPAPVPAFDPRYDYYTGDPDQSVTGNATGGAPTTLAGYGPNTRTIMQFQVAGPAAPAFNLAALNATIPVAFAQTQSPPLVPQSTYPAPFQAGTSTYSKIQDTSLTFNPVGALSPNTGAVGSVNVTSGGSGYTSAPTVVFTGGGTGAAATATVLGGVVTGVTVTNGGSGYNALPLVSFTGGGVSPVSATASASYDVTIPMQPKAIQELFELDYGRMNATLGVELPFTNFNTQTTIPLGYIDPLTEEVSASATPGPIIMGDGTQIWKITHNGVDTHAIHFHLFNVQLINRVGWDGQIVPPDANELGWKETVRMHPLQDAIVALRPIVPVLPWPIPNSIRPLDPTKAVGSTLTVTNPADGNAIPVTNAQTDFGWEYVWHCHLLGHEENDMMRPLAFRVEPQPNSLTATYGAPNVSLAWANPASSMPVASYTIQRAIDAAFTPGPTTVTFSTAGPTTYTDGGPFLAPITYYYRVRSVSLGVYSMWSNTATVTAP